MLTLADAENLKLKEQIAQNLKLDEQTAQLLQQIMLLQDQIDALRSGLTLADLGVDPESFVHSKYIILWACNTLSTNSHH